MRAAGTAAVEVALQHARDLGRGGGQRGELIEGQDEAGGGGLEEALEERIPVGVVDPLEAGEATADLARHGGPLEDVRAIVGHVVHGAAFGQSLLDEPRLAEATPAIDHGERGRRRLGEAPQACSLLVAVEEGQLHGQ